MAYHYKTSLLQYLGNAWGYGSTEFAHVHDHKYRGRLKQKKSIPVDPHGCWLFKEKNMKS